MMKSILQPSAWLSRPRSIFPALGRLGLTALMMFVAMPSIGAAGEEVTPQLAAGYEELQSALKAKSSGAPPSVFLPRFRRAAQLFQAAERAQPDASRPIFFEGIALIGAEDFGGAVQKLKRAEAMGDANPDLRFELGVALLGAEARDEGESYLRRYLAGSVGTGGNRMEARRLLAVATSMQEKAVVTVPTKPATSPPKELPFDVSILGGVGYNSNVIKLGKDFPLPKRITQKSAFFSESGVSLRKEFPLGLDEAENPPKDKLLVTYSGQVDLYDGIASSNLLLQTGSLQFTHTFTPELRAGLKFSDLWLRVAEENIFNQIVAQPSLTYSATDWLTTQLLYTVTWADFFTPKTRPTDPRGFTHRLELAGTVTAGEKDPASKQARVTLLASYAHGWISTFGIVGDQQLDDLLGKVTILIHKPADKRAFLREITFIGSYEHFFNNYTHPTLPTLVYLNRSTRGDERDLVTVALSTKLWYDNCVAANRLEFTLSQLAAFQDSNSRKDAYHQRVFLASLNINL